MDDFRQQVAKVAFNVSNLLLYLRNRRTSSGDVENTLNTQPWFGSFCATYFLSLLHPSLGFVLYFGNRLARSTILPIGLYANFSVEPW